MGEQGIIALVLLGLLSLVFVAFMVQTVENNRQERLRQEAILRKRANNLSYMLDYFPTDFLSTDLKVLVCRSLLNVYKRLTQLVSNSHEYRVNMVLIYERLTKEAKREQTAHYQPLENPEQIKEIKSTLGMLSKSIDLLCQEQSITRQQAQNYADQIKALISRATIDSYILSAKQAEEEESLPMAVHYYHSALEQIESQNLMGVYSNHIGSVEDKISELEAMSSSKSAATNEETDTSRNKEWNEYLNEGDLGKKKYYDL